MSEKQEPIQLSEIKKPSPVFCNRLGGKQHYIGEVCFELRALPASVDYYLRSRVHASGDRAAMQLDMLRLGVVGIRGLCDQHGLKVKPQFDQVIVLGRKFAALSWETIDGLAVEVQDELVAEIMMLCDRAEKENQAQDFIPPSSEASAAGAGIDAPVADE